MVLRHGASLLTRTTKGTGSRKENTKVECPGPERDLEGDGRGGGRGRVLEREPPDRGSLLFRTELGTNWEHRVPTPDCGRRPRILQLRWLKRTGDDPYGTGGRRGRL